MKLKLIIPAIVLLLSLTQCSKKIQLPPPEVQKDTTYSYQEDDFVPYLVSYIREYGTSMYELKRIYFYNSAEIKMDFSGTITTSKVVNGRVIVDRKKEEELKIVPRGTVGVIKATKKDKKNGDMVLVSFSKKDPTFRFWFHVQTDGTFKLVSSGTDAPNGKYYNITTKNCKLLFSRTIYTRTIYSENEAEGDTGN